MKKKFLAGLSVVLMFFGMSGIAGATTLTSKISVDNQFEIFLSTDATSQGISFGSGNNWQTVYTPSTQLNAGTDYYLHVWGKNFPATHTIDGPNPAGFLGEFTLSGTDHAFENNSQTLFTNTTDWQGNKTGWGDPSVGLTDFGANGVSPWGGHTAAIADSAHWIWAGVPDNRNFYPANDVSLFSARIISATVPDQNPGVPSPTPEPATMLLFGLGLIGIAGAGRRKMK